MNSYRITRNRVIILPVKIYGPKGFTFTNAILDTGATYTLFPPALLSSIGYTPSSDKTLKIITASSIEYVPTVNINSLELLGMQAQNVQVVSHLLPAGIPAQGLIGINALQPFLLEINFPELTLSLR